MTTLDETTALRAAMVDELRGGLDAIRSEPVARAFLAVPRHLFAPWTPPELVYHPNTSVWPKRDGDGAVVSTVSAAHIQAVMLEQAALAPGLRVLEIGSGGYNAALISEIVGPDGEVTTVDIDPEIVDRARTCLDAAGYPHVRTIVADADGGVPAHAPYDRIVVTVRSWDVPPAWTAQLAPGGRIVLPLRMRGLTRSVALDQVGAGADGLLLRGGDVRLCSFVPMQGAGAHDEPVVTADGGRIQLRAETDRDPAHDEDLRATAEVLASAVRGPRTEVWTGVEFDHVDDLDLWLGMRLPRFGILTATQEIVDDGLLTPGVRRGMPTLFSAGGITYRTKRPVPGTDGFETGVLAWGSDAAGLAETYAETVRGWGRYRQAGGSGPGVEIRAAASVPTDDGAGPRIVLRKRHTIVVLSWPSP